MVLSTTAKVRICDTAHKAMTFKNKNLKESREESVLIPSRSPAFALTCLGTSMDGQLSPLNR
jgi:hypothetical protein